MNYILRMKSGLNLEDIRNEITFYLELTYLSVDKCPGKSERDRRQDYLGFVRKMPSSTITNTEIW